MPKLPSPTGAEMVRFLQSQGFTVIRIRGSHHVMAHGAVRTSVPVHGSRTLKLGTFRGILRDIEMSAAKFAEIWNG